MATKAPAPVKEIGYASTATSYNWTVEGETTPELQWPQSVEVFDAMRRTDAQVTSVLRAVTLPVRRTPWRIDPAGARAEVVQLIADDLGLPIVGQTPKVLPRTKDRFSWAEHLRLALLMLPFGFSFFEQTYRIDPDGSRAHLHKLGQRPARTIQTVDVARDGGLISITQYGTLNNDGPQNPIPVSRLVAYVLDREGGNWLGQSVLRSAYKNFLIKERLLRVQAQTIERNGMGVPLYKAAETETELATGLGMATSWRAGEAAGSAIPFGADLVLRGVEGQLPDAEPAVRYHDEQIARAVLAHFLNLGTQTGSWALGTTFADFFTLSLQTLAQQVADVATQHIIEDLVDINFGEDEPAPRLTFDEIGSRQAATAQALKSLVDSGIVHPDEVLEESSRQQYGLPPADPATATAPTADVTGDGTPPGASEPDVRPGSVAAAGDVGPKASAATAAGYEQPALDAPEPVAAARKPWDLAKHPRDPVTGRFITLAAFADLVKKLDNDRTENFDHRIKDAASGMDAIAAAPLGLYNGDPGLSGALSSYVAGGHGDINTGLRAGNLSAPGRVRTVAEIDRGMRKSPLDSDAQVWRGVSNPEKVFGSAWNDTDVSGLEWREAGYGSTSAKQSVAERSMFAGKDGVVMRILAPKGTRALAILGPSDSDDFSEDELLIDRGVRYRIVADHGIVNGRRHLDVEIIHD